MIRYFIVCILLFSCSSLKEEEKENNSIFIDISQSKAGVLSDVYEDIEYVYLQNADKFPLVRPFKVKINFNLIGIEDTGAEQYVFYNFDGIPIVKIPATGAGPGEFGRTEDFQIFSDSIVIKDPMTSKLIAFDRFGRFLSEQKSLVQTSYFFRTSSSIIHYSKNIFEHGFFHFYIEGDNEILGEMPTKPTVENVVFADKDGFELDEKNNQIVFKIPFSTQVATFNLDGQLKEIYNFDFGANSLKDEDRVSLSESEINDLVLNRNLVSGISSLYPLSDGYFLSFGAGFKESHQVFLDRNFKILHQLKNFKNDIDGLPIRTIPWFHFQNKIGYLIPSGEFYADYLEKFGSEKEQPSNNLHRFVKKYNNALGEDSYVLIFLKVKDSIWNNKIRIDEDLK